VTDEQARSGGFRLGSLMIETKVRIQNKLGLHARPAARFVKTASRFRSDVCIARDDQVVNGKSIMGVMMLAAEFGSELIISAAGDDEEQAMKALVDLFERKFDED
jgi:phosphocarrier protein